MVESVGGGVDLVVFVPVGEVVEFTEELMVPVRLDHGDSPVVARRGEVERPDFFPSGYRRWVNPTRTVHSGERGLELGDHHLPGGAELLFEQLVARPSVSSGGGTDRFGGCSPTRCDGLSLHSIGSIPLPSPLCR